VAEMDDMIPAPDHSLRKWTLRMKPSDRTQIVMIIQPRLDAGQRIESEQGAVLTWSRRRGNTGWAAQISCGGLNSP